jgi:hypothetical protein
VREALICRNQEKPPFSFVVICAGGDGMHAMYALQYSGALLCSLLLLACQLCWQHGASDCVTYMVSTSYILADEQVPFW